MTINMFKIDRLHSENSCYSMYSLFFRQFQEWSLNTRKVAWNKKIYPDRQTVWLNGYVNYLRLSCYLYALLDEIVKYITLVEHELQNFSKI